MCIHEQTVLGGVGLLSIYNHKRYIFLVISNYMSIDIYPHPYCKHFVIKILTFDKLPPHNLVTY